MNTLCYISFLILFYSLNISYKYFNPCKNQKTLKDIINLASNWNLQLKRKMKLCKTRKLKLRGWKLSYHFCRKIWETKRYPLLRRHLLLQSLNQKTQRLLILKVWKVGILWCVNSETQQWVSEYLHSLFSELLISVIKDTLRQSIS